MAEPTLAQIHHLLVQMRDDQQETLSYRDGVRQDISSIREHVESIDARTKSNETAISALQRASHSPEVVALVKLANNIEGITWFGKLAWGVIAIVVPIVLAWLAYTQSKAH